MANPEPDSRPQADKFRDLARELECDEDEAAFEERVKRIASRKSPVSKEGTEPPEESDSVL